MKQKKRFLFLSVLGIVTLLSGSVAWGQVEDVATYSEGQSITAPAKVQVIKKTSTSLKISWSKVEGASGYAIYRCNPKAKAYKLIKTLDNNKLTWTNKKLKKNKIYKYKIRTFTREEDETIYSTDSYMVSAKTFTKKAKKVNVKSVKVDYKNRYLGLEGVAKVHARVSVPKGKKAINKKLKWTSSDPSVVKVTKNGWIKGRGEAGKAKVYVRAHNGKTKILNITVADYANPASFNRLDEVKEWDYYAEYLLIENKEEICKVATFLEKYKGDSYFYYDGKIRVKGKKVDISTIKPELEILLGDMGLEISLTEGCVYFLDDEYFISYLNFKLPEYAYYGAIKIAPCWYFYGSDWWS